jgi:hypothetical protein
MRFGWDSPTDHGYCRFGNSWSFCQNSDFHGNSDIQNSQKLEPLEITAKKFQAKICYPFKDILVPEIDPWWITKSRISYT